jgi:hypothetical protein
MAPQWLRSDEIDVGQGQEARGLEFLRPYPQLHQILAIRYSSASADRPTPGSGFWPSVFSVAAVVEAVAVAPVVAAVGVA